MQEKLRIKKYQNSKLNPAQRKSVRIIQKANPKAHICKPHERQDHDLQTVASSSSCRNHNLFHGQIC